MNFDRNGQMIIVIQILKHGRKVSELSYNNRISNTSIYNWIKKYKDEIEKPENKWMYDERYINEF